MRVTDGSITTRVLANLQRNVARSAKIQEHLSSGKQINRPSDSPTTARWRAPCSSTSRPPSKASSR